MTTALFKILDFLNQRNNESSRIFFFVKNRFSAYFIFRAKVILRTYQTPTYKIQIYQKYNSSSSNNLDKNRKLFLNIECPFHSKRRNLNIHRLFFRYVFWK